MLDELHNLFEREFVSLRPDDLVPDFNICLGR